jgi:hypothetical protein
MNDDMKTEPMSREQILATLREDVPEPSSSTEEHGTDLDAMATQVLTRSGEQLGEDDDDLEVVQTLSIAEVLDAVETRKADRPDLAMLIAMSDPSVVGDHPAESKTASVVRPEPRELHDTPAQPTRRAEVEGATGSAALVDGASVTQLEVGGVWVIVIVAIVSMVTGGALVWALI